MHGPRHPPNPGEMAQGMVHGHATTTAIPMSIPLAIPLGMPLGGPTPPDAKPQQAKPELGKVATWVEDKRNKLKRAFSEIDDLDNVRAAMDHLAQGQAEQLFGSVEDMYAMLNSYVAAAFADSTPRDVVAVESPPDEP